MHLYLTRINRYMRKAALIMLAWSMVLAPRAFAQWTACTSGSTTCTTQSVGIGTTGPSTLLHVNGSGVQGKFQGLNGATYIGDGQIYTDRGVLYIEFTNPSSPIDFQAGKIYFDNTGRIGIGTSSPAAKLHINTNDGEAVRLTRSGAYWNYIATYRDGTRQGVIGDLISGWGLWTDDSVPLLFFTGGGYERLRIDNLGNVGIGTPAPVHTLDVWGSSILNGQSREVLGVYDTSPYASGIGGGIVFGGRFSSAGTMAQQFASIQGIKENAVDGDFASALRFFTRVNNANPLERVRISSVGNVGIGNTNPDALLTVGAANGTGNKLTVNGDVTVTGNIGAKYQDVAEWVPTAEDMTPGTVVVLNPLVSNEVMRSSVAYDTTVAGVVSASPGVILGESSASKAKIATTGRVRVRVDASHAPIHIGDLLVTSDKSGVAMRSEPMEINGRKFHQPGTIIGKALEPLGNGQGEILVLLSLQ